jgi:hypothetical protein
MNKHQLRSLIKKTIVGKLQRQGINKYKEYKVLNHVPDLISILTDLMSPQFNLFVRDIEWVAPKPPTFRIVLENDQFFYLYDLRRSWVAEVEGKKYYLLNLGEEEMQCQKLLVFLDTEKQLMQIWEKNSEQVEDQQAVEEVPEAVEVETWKQL